MHATPALVLSLSFSSLAAAQSSLQQAATPLPPSSFAVQVVQLQPTTPGTAQNGNVNVTGALIAGSLAGNGAALSNLNAGAVTAGILADARLSANVPRLGTAQTFTGPNSFSSSVLFTAAGAAFSVANSIKINSLNCDQLDGLDSSAFLQAVPLTLVSPVTDSTAISATANNGWGSRGVHGTADHGVGVVGTSADQIGVAGDSINGIGMYATSQNYIGLISESYGTGYAGIFGFNGGTGMGVVGASNGGNGVQGSTTAAVTSGVYGEGPGNGYGVAGRVVGANGGGIGVYADAPPNMLALFVTRDTFLGEDLYVAGAKTGYVADIVRNVGREPLECGDLVEIVGASEPVLGEIPVIDVRKASSAAPQATLGPIATALSVKPCSVVPPPLADGKPAPALAEGVMEIHKREGSVAPGDYGTVVTLGSFKAIKVDASYGAIRPGDPLVASPNPGYAMQGFDAPAGAVIGNALGSLAGGRGSMAVMIDRR
ncbi:MAG TPA: hypothetical protein VK843_11095 [Planctomycetota bacterium]|nr:hypothetical protein [Planctomycetota bacterium]